jgi:hypothetical protein
MQAWSNNNEENKPGASGTEGGLIGADAGTGQSSGSPDGRPEVRDEDDNADVVEVLQSPKRQPTEIAIEDLDFVADSASTKWRKNKLQDLEPGDSREALKTIKYTIPRKGGAVEDPALEKGVRKMLKGVKEKRAAKQAQMSTATKVFMDSGVETAFQTTIVTRKELLKFYEVHDKSKVKDVDRIVKAYKTDELVAALAKKYEAAPPTVEAIESTITTKQLTDFYWQYDPARVETVERKLATYRTHDLMELLQEQYGTAPAPMPKTLLVRGAEIAKKTLEKEKAKTDAEQQAWEAFYEPTQDAYYYFNTETWQSVWEAPEGYIMTATEEELVATLKVQRWHQRCKAVRKVQN